MFIQARSLLLFVTPILLSEYQMLALSRSRRVHCWSESVIPAMVHRPGAVHNASLRFGYLHRSRFFVLISSITALPIDNRSIEALGGL